MATIPNVNRAQIVMDLIKDAEVTTLANYASDKVDYLNGATAIKYVDPVLLIYGNVTQEMIDGWTENEGTPEEVVHPAMTNEEKALRYMDILKEFHRRSLRAASVPSAVDSYRQTETDTVTADAITDLGADEYTPA